MKRRLLILSAVLAVLAVMIAGPALACEPLRGEMELDLNPGFVPDGTECPETLTWSGTVDFGDATYGIAYFPNAPLITVPGGWIIFQEDWTFFTLPGEDESVSLIDAACDESRVVLAGQDVGLGAPVGGGFAIGPLPTFTLRMTAKVSSARCSRAARCSGPDTLRMTLAPSLLATGISPPPTITTTTTDR